MEREEMQLSPVLALHVCAGSVGLAAGTVAICVRKGGRSHGLAGTVFSIAMLCLAASGVYLAYRKSQAGNILGGALTFYMIATAWMTAKRRKVETGIFDWVALAVALTIGIACVTYGFQVVRAGSNDGVPAGMDFFLGTVVLLAAAGDIQVLARGGVWGTQRISRHLWRMCFGLFIASGSFFMGRQRIFPEVIRRSNVLLALTILPLFLLVLWLVRVRFTRVYERGMAPRRAYTSSP
jgi:uncharacterized membrane protein